MLAFCEPKGFNLPIIFALIVNNIIAEVIIMNVKFYVCKHCGNIVTFVENKGVPVMCCGEKMSEITANTTEAATEKHVPVVDVCENKVTVNVGSVEHPMEEKHSIKWICVETESGFQIKHLNPGEKPVKCFRICDGDSVKNVYAYCDLHGLWKA